MEERRSHDRFEFFSPRELKQEAATLFSRLSSDAGNVSSEMTLNEMLRSREYAAGFSSFTALVSKARITKSFYNHIVGSFFAASALGKDFSDIEQLVLGEEGTDGIFDPHIARVQELQYLMDWKDRIEEAYKSIQEDEDSPTKLGIVNHFQMLSAWREEINELHGESVE